MASCGSVMAMGPGEVYLSSSSPPLQQWPGAARFGGPRIVLSSSSSTAQPTPRTAQPVLSLPSRTPSQLRPEVAGKPSFPSDTSRSLTVQNSSASTDEGFFRKRRGEGISSGGGPSTINLFSRSDTASSVLSSTAPVTGLLPPRTQRSEAERPTSIASASPVPASKDSLHASSSSANGVAGKAAAKLHGGQLPRRSFEQRSPRNMQQSAELTSRQQNGCQIGKVVDGRSHNGGLSLEATAGGYRRGVSEGSVERARTGEGPRAGRGGAGRSSGGGPSSISLGSPDEMSRSRSVDTFSPQSQREFGRSSPLALEKSSPARQYVYDDGVESNVARTPSTVEPPRSSVADSQSAANFSDLGGEGRLSYAELLAENDYLRQQLSEAHNELASYRRWYG